MKNIDSILNEMILNNTLSHGKTIENQLNESSVFSYMFNLKPSNLKGVSNNKNRITNVASSNIGEINRTLKNSKIDELLRNTDVKKSYPEYVETGGNANAIVSVVDKAFMQADQKTQEGIKYDKSKTSEYQEYAAGIILKTFAIAGSALAIYQGGKYINKYSKFGKPLSSKSAQLFVFTIIPFISAILTLLALIQSVSSYKEISGRSDESVFNNLKSICSSFSLKFVKYSKQDLTWATLGVVLAAFTWFVASDKNMLINFLSGKISDWLIYLQKTIKIDNLKSKITSAASKKDEKSLFPYKDIADKVNAGLDKLKNADSKDLLTSEFKNSAAQKAMLKTKVTSAIRTSLIVFVALTVVYMMVEMVDTYNRKRLIEKVKSEDE